MGSPGVGGVVGGLGCGVGWVVFVGVGLVVLVRVVGRVGFSIGLVVGVGGRWVEERRRRSVPRRAPTVGGSRAPVLGERQDDHKT